MFQSLQLIIIVVFILIANGSLVLASFGSCPGGPSSCRNGPAIPEPFWIDNGSANCSGNPGFEIRCDAGNGKPVMNISNNLYYVLYFEDTIMYVSGTLTLLDVDIDGKGCPQPRRNLSIQSQPFLSYASGHQNIIFFYNCTNPPENVVQHIPCLPNYNNDTIRSYAFEEGQIPTGFNWYDNCSENVVLPVSTVSSRGELLLLDNYTQAIERGFRLKWSNPVYSGQYKKLRILGIVIIAVILALVVGVAVALVKCCMKLKRSASNKEALDEIKGDNQKDDHGVSLVHTSTPG